LKSVEIEEERTTGYFWENDYCFFGNNGRFLVRKNKHSVFEKKKVVYLFVQNDKKRKKRWIDI